MKALLLQSRLSNWTRSSAAISSIQIRYAATWCGTGWLTEADNRRDTILMKCTCHWVLFSPPKSKQLTVAAPLGQAVSGEEENSWQRDASTGSEAEHHRVPCRRVAIANDRHQMMLGLWSFVSMSSIVQVDGWTRRPRRRCFFHLPARELLQCFVKSGGRL